MRLFVVIPRKWRSSNALFLFVLAMAGASGGSYLLVRNGDVVLRIVGHLITGFYGMLFDRIDPTYPIASDLFLHLGGIS